MNSSRRFTYTIALTGLCLLTAAQVSAAEGYFVAPRVFNDNAGSTLSITPPSPIATDPATITIRDEFTGAFTGANRHDALFSMDGGVSAYQHSIDESFVFTTMLNLTAGQNSPRKEAGIRINSGVSGDALFIVNSDAGEIVTFGGGAPFHLFGNNGGGNGYTPGTSILLGVRHIAGGDGNGGIPNTIEFFIDRGSGIETSGPRVWDNLENGPVDFTVGVYAQGGASGEGDFINAVFTDTTYTIVPEPGVLGFAGLGLALLGLIRRRA